VCDGCQQAGNLKIKLVGHFGEAAVQKVKHLTELAGVDVILVHRMLKNDVPVPEYLLMTEPVHQRIDTTMRERAASHALELDDLGRTDTYYVDLERYVGEVPPSPRPLDARTPRAAHEARHAIAAGVHRLRKACVGFRNIPDAPPLGSH
jgi:hypothetical protein